VWVGGVLCVCVCACVCVCVCARARVCVCLSVSLSVRFLSGLFLLYFYLINRVLQFARCYCLITLTLIWVSACMSLWVAGFACVCVWQRDVLFVCQSVFVSCTGGGDGGFVMLYWMLWFFLILSRTGT
jgi:hypothetical protein